MYGGGHYIASAVANDTPQGRAIFLASTKFGDGRTLPVSVEVGERCNPHTTATGRRLNFPISFARFCLSLPNCYSSSLRVNDITTRSLQTEQHECTLVGSTAS